jgi:hypothetical protein
MKSKVWFAVPTLVLLVLFSHHANSETKPAPTVFTGKVVGITDGDTVKVLRDNQTVKVRLSGIDTPEMDQPFGKESKRFVSKLIFGKTVDVKDLGLDRYDRTLGYITEGSTEVNPILRRVIFGSTRGNPRCLTFAAILPTITLVRQFRPSALIGIPIVIIYHSLSIPRRSRRL